MIRLCSASELSHVPRERLAFCGGLFLLADLLVVTRAWSNEDEVFVFVIALLFAQCSLVTFLAMTRNLPEIIRYAAPTVATGGCVFVLMKLLPIGVGSDALAQIILLMAGHAMATMLGTALHRQWHEKQLLRLTFSISTLVTWTTLVAVLIALGRAVGSKWQLTPQAFMSPESLTLLLLGMLYGMSSIGLLHAFWTIKPWQRSRRLVTGSVVAVVGIYAFTYGVNWFRSGDNYFEPLLFIRLMIYLAIILCCSMMAMLFRKERQITAVARSN